MKNVVKLFVAVAVMSVVTVSSFAQGAGPAKAGGAQKGGKAGGPGGPGGMRRGGMMNMDEAILAKLNLTADQKKKVAALKEATKKKSDDFRKTLMAGAGAGKAGAGKAGAGAAGGQGRRIQLTEEQRNKLKAIGEGYQTGMKKILTPTQQAGYEKEMKAQREKMRAQFQKAGGPAGGPGAGKGKGKNIPPQS